MKSSSLSLGRPEPGSYHFLRSGQLGRESEAQGTGCLLVFPFLPCHRNSPGINWTFWISAPSQPLKSCKPVIWFCCIHYLGQSFFFFSFFMSCHWSIWLEMHFFPQMVLQVWTLLQKIPTQSFSWKLALVAVDFDVEKMNSDLQSSSPSNIPLKKNNCRA